MEIIFIIIETFTAYNNVDPMVTNGYTFKRRTVFIAVRGSSESGVCRRQILTTPTLKELKYLQSLLTHNIGIQMN